MKPDHKKTIKGAGFPNRTAVIRAWQIMTMPGNKYTSVRLGLLLACVLIPGIELRAQQTNLQLLVPPSVDISRDKTREIYGSYIDVHGERVDLNGLDFSVVFGERKSSSTYSNVTMGAALLGTSGNETLYLDGVRRDVVGMTLHGSPSRYYLYGEGKFQRWMLLASAPVSFGSFSICKGGKEEGKFYNLLAGVQGGAALNFIAGNFLAAPSLTLGLMGGYVEKYKGGTYWSNMSSGGVRPFAVMTLGADLAYLPKEAKLSAIYQRTFSSGSNRAMDALLIKFTLGWDALHRKKGKAAPSQ